MIDRPPPARSAFLPVAAVWAVTCLFLVAIAIDPIRDALPTDPDDFLRLVEVRDWLAGQSWFDVTQYRMNPPAGGSMHWSRLVDLPIAALLVALRPLVGGEWAERLTLLAIPFASLAMILALSTAIVRRLFTAPSAPLLGAVLLVCCPYIVSQVQALRIDHHAWQLIFSAAAVLALLDWHARRSGALAGTALAFGLAISLEGLIFVAACAALLALRACLGGDHGRRFVAFAATLAVSATGLAVLQQGAVLIRQPYCDVLTPGHLAAFAIMTATALWMARSDGAPPIRLAWLALGGLVAVAAIAAISPVCASNPFSRMDPLVHRVWYLNVMEGLPIWRQSPVTALGMIWFPLIGLVGGGVALRTARDDAARRDWVTILAVATAAFVVALLVRRAGHLAHLLAIPGALALLLPLHERTASATALRAALLRVGGFVLLSPLPPLYVDLLVPAANDVAAHPGGCNLTCSARMLNSLPPSDFLATLNLGPYLLAKTPHRMIASGYHRNDRDIAEVIRAFAGSDADADADAIGTIRRRRLSYVLIEPDSGEPALYRSLAPHGLMARLLADRPPAWLTPVPLGASRLRLWRVVPERLP